MMLPKSPLLEFQIDEVLEGDVLERGKKKTNYGNQVAEIQGKGGERKKDYGNQVVENGMKKRKREKNSDQKILNDVSTKEQA